MKPDVLVVDDEIDIREAICGILEDSGDYETRQAGDAEAALKAIALRKPALIILDVWLSERGMDGLEMLSYVRELDPLLPVIVISGHGSIETAVSAIRKGAYDYIEKPFAADRLTLVVERALEAASLRRENDALRQQSVASSELIGQSSAATTLRGLIDKVGPTNSRVFITGPSGSGKELVARLIHQKSSRSAGPFVPVNAASIAPDRMEQALFGEDGEPGRPAKIGLLEQAHNGTLFLDEVMDMPSGTQAKVLRVLIDQRFRRLNGAADVAVNVRVISSTARNPADAIENSVFREDLFHRLNVVPIKVPGIGERRDDLPELIEAFVERLSLSSGLPVRAFSDELVAALQAADWPGNIRQLRNVIERVLILAGGEPDTPIGVDDLPDDLLGGAKGGRAQGPLDLIGLPLRDARERFERDYLAVQVTRFGGNISKTAAFIGMERSALHRKLKSLGVTSDGGGGKDSA